jgi:hypothetical protein
MMALAGDGLDSSLAARLGLPFPLFHSRDTGLNRLPRLAAALFQRQRYE